MANRGWRPTSGGADGDASDQTSPPAPARRRRRKAADEPATPLVDKAIENSPRASTGERPEPGKRDRTRTSLTVQLGDRWARIVRSIKASEMTWQEFVEGLDEEELARGQLKAEDGTFRGRPPTLVPREFHLACQREMKRRFEELFGSEVLGLTKEYLRLCKDSSIPPDKRAKLLQYAMERVFGGIPKDVRISQEAPWEQMVVNVTRDGDEDPGTGEHRSRRYDAYAERLGIARSEGD